MKSIWKICIMFMASSVLLTSCQKDDRASLTGGYTFKTGGQLKVLPTALAGNDVDAVAACSELSGYDLANLWVPLQPESGGLAIVYTNETKDSLVLVFSALLGDVCTLSGTLHGDTLTLSGDNVKSMQVTDGSASLGGGFVTVTGEGKSIDDNLLITLHYAGTFNSTVTGQPVEMTIMDSRISCVAQKTSVLGDNYAYKTGGQIRLMPTVLTDSVVNAVEACSALCGYDLSDLWLPLKPESGAMNITSSDANALTLSFDALLGDVCTLTAVGQGDEITLSGDNRKTMQLTDGENSLGGGIVSVTGGGSMDDGTLRLNLRYHGSFTSPVIGRPIEMTIMDSHIECIAKKNEK